MHARAKLLTIGLFSNVTMVVPKYTYNARGMANYE